MSELDNIKRKLRRRNLHLKQSPKANYYWVDSPFGYCVAAGRTAEEACRKALEWYEPKKETSKYNDADLVQRLAHHIGHKVVISGYGLNAKEPWMNIALECDECGVVLFDWNVHKTKKGYTPDVALIV